MQDLNTKLANKAVTFGNVATKAKQAADEFRRLAEWRSSSPILSALDQREAMQLDNEATFWRLQQEFAKQGVLLHDPSNPNWAMGEFRDLIQECAKEHRLVFVQYDSAGRLQPTPYAPGITPAAVAV
jgi:hypothetical protein